MKSKIDVSSESNSSGKTIKNKYHKGIKHDPYSTFRRLQ